MTIEDKILKVVDEKHGAFWGEFYDALVPTHSADDILNTLRSLVQRGVLRMKEDSYEHDWEYRRVKTTR